MTPRDLRSRLQRSTGLDLSQSAVNAALKQRMRQTGTHEQQAYLTKAASDPMELDALIELVVVPESWFFRDADAFQAALDFTRQRLSSGKRPVRILSIPCAAGEEPYSLAMTLLDGGIGESDFCIDAVDISKQALARARCGLYQRNAFRTTDLAFRDRHFTWQAEGYCLHTNVRRQVSFRHANLLSLHRPRGHRYDTIFCRNLLIYFDEPTQRAAIAKLDALLADDGLLFTGYAETASVCRHGFSMAPLPMAFALAKRGNDAPEHKPAQARRTGRIGAQRAHRIPGIIQPATATPLPRPVSRVAAPEERLLKQARELADNGNRDAARAAFHAYLQQVPDSAEAYFMLGLLREQEHDTQAAQECMRRAVYLDPEHYDALCHLALIAEGGGDEAAARTLRQRARRVFERQQEKRNRE